MESSKPILNAYLAMVVLCAGLAAVLASLPTLANPGATKTATKKKSLDPCAYPATEESLVSCRKREFDGAETDVAKLVATLSKSYARDVALAGVFSTAQTKWREFRDAECKLTTYDSQGGTAYESYWLECLGKLDRDRIKTLEDLRDHP